MDFILTDGHLEHFSLFAMLPRRQITILHLPGPVSGVQSR